MSETVDILMATYETNSHFLKQQIDSILNQTYPNIHLIISDDNSSSPEVQAILKETCQQDKRVELYIQPKNVGYIKNFEFLLMQSKAEYICFSDHDDVWKPEKVEKQLQILQKNQVDMVYCNCMQIDENGNIIHENYFQYKNMPLVEGKNQKLGKSRYLGIGCSQMFTKAIKEKILPFKPEVMAQDWLVSFMANENKGVCYIEEPLFFYRLHTSNIFGGRSLEQNLSRWKEIHGNTYKSYLQYRAESVIGPAYLDGVKMCLAYCQEEKTRKWLQNIIHYYNRLNNLKIYKFPFFIIFPLLSRKKFSKKNGKRVCYFSCPISRLFAFQIN